MSDLVRTPEEAAREYVDDRWKRSTEGGDAQDLADLIRARDAEIRADERARVSVVHSTLTDQDLLDELVRRGVLTEVRVRDLPAVRIMLRDHLDAEPYLVREEREDECD